VCGKVATFTCPRGFAGGAMPFEATTEVVDLIKFVEQQHAAPWAWEWHPTIDDDDDDDDDDVMAMTMMTITMTDDGRRTTDDRQRRGGGKGGGEEGGGGGGDDDDDDDNDGCWMMHDGWCFDDG